MVARLRLLLFACAVGALVAGAALAGSAKAGPPGPSGPPPPPPPPAPANCPGSTPVAQREAATSATFNSIETKIAAGTRITTRFPDPTAAEDILDYGINDLWQKGIDGSCVTVAYIVTNP